MISLKALGIPDAIGFLEKTHKNAQRAGRVANTKVGFKYRRIMASEIARGRAGGVMEEPLSQVMVRYKRFKNIRSKRPLGTFGRFIRHRVSGKDGSLLEIGMLQTGPYAAPSLEVKKFRELVSGFTAMVQTKTRRFFRIYGRPRTARAKSYVLKKGTRSTKIPARPVVDNFFKRYAQEMINDYEKVWFATIMGRYIRL